MSSYSDVRLTESLDGCTVRVVDRDRVADVRASMPADGATAEDASRS
jgi:hypothetical protein